MIIATDLSEKFKILSRSG